jgi:hypothetical protein
MSPGAQNMKTGLDVLSSDENGSDSTAKILVPKHKT